MRLECIYCKLGSMLSDGTSTAKLCILQCWTCRVLIIMGYHTKRLNIVQWKCSCSDAVVLMPWYWCRGTDEGTARVDCLTSLRLWMDPLSSAVNVCCCWLKISAWPTVPKLLHAARQTTSSASQFQPASVKQYLATVAQSPVLLLLLLLKLVTAIYIHHLLVKDQTHASTNQKPAFGPNTVSARSNC